MSQYPNPYGMNRSNPWELAGTSNPAIFRFFNMVYAWMCAGLGVTAIVALMVSQYLERVLATQGYGGLRSIGPIFIGLLIAQFVLVMVISAATQRISAPLATVLFLLYAALSGVTLSGVFMVYARSSLASAFVISAGTFGAMSAYGMLTRRDLTGIGRILIMVLIGLVIASIVSIFWHNTMLQVVMNYVGVLVFVGLTAYDTQKLKQIAEQTDGNPAMASRLAIVGSLVLYLDFINLFLFILRIMGDRRR